MIIETYLLNIIIGILPRAKCNITFYGLTGMFEQVNSLMNCMKVSAHITLCFRTGVIHWYIILYSLLYRI